jgi:hypothetical protein
MNSGRKEREEWEICCKEMYMSNKQHNTEPQNHTSEGEILLKTIERFFKSSKINDIAEVYFSVKYIGQWVTTILYYYAHNEHVQQRLRVCEKKGLREVSGSNTK